VNGAAKEHRPAISREYAEATATDGTVTAGSELTVEESYCAAIGCEGSKPVGRLLNQT